MYSYKVFAKIHSLKGERREVTIMRCEDGSYIAEYNGIKCQAILNCFDGEYYADDIYGIIK